MSFNTFSSELPSIHEPERPMFGYSSTQVPQESIQTLAEEWEGEVVDEHLLILVESLRKVSTKSREFLLIKFFCDLAPEIPFESSLKERLRDTKFGGISDLFEEVNLEANNHAATNLRGLENDSSTMINQSIPEGDIPGKLERFRIRTPDLVVEDEKKGSSESKTS